MSIEWISIKEPPKEIGKYLCYFKFEPYAANVISENLYLGNGLWQEYKSKITHWAFLPIAPKEGVEE